MEKKLLNIIDRYFNTIENIGMIDKEKAHKVFKAFALYEFLASDDSCLSEDQKDLIKDTIECLFNINCFRFAKISFCQTEVTPITNNDYCKDFVCK